MLNDLKECLIAFQAIDAWGKTTLGMVAVLIVGGVIALFILAAILPNPCIAVSTLTAIAGILAGRSSK